MHRAKAPRGFSERPRVRLPSDRAIGAVDVTDDIAHGVRRVLPIVHGIDVLRAAQTRKSVDENDDGGRHAPVANKPVGPLKHVRLPRPRARSARRRRRCSRAARRAPGSDASPARRNWAADRRRPAASRGRPTDCLARAALSTKSMRTSPSKPRSARDFGALVHGAELRLTNGPRLRCSCSAPSICAARFRSTSSR